MLPILAEKLESRAITLKANEKLLYVFALDTPQQATLHFDLIGEGAELNVIGFINGKGSDQFNIETRVRHLAPRTRGHMYIKGIMRDQSKASYSGLIRIEKPAIGADAYLAHHTLLMSKQAGAKSVPSLEIEADDIKAGHSASVGQVDEEAMFYLMSRGMSHDEAKQMLVEGFFEELIVKIPDEQIREHIRQKLYV